MDVLNEVLRSLQIKSTCYGRAEFTAPWGLQVPSYPGHSGFFVVNRGNCLLELESPKKSIALTGGDFVLFPHGGAYVLKDKSNSRTVHLEKLLSGGKKTLSFGGGGAVTTIVNGCFQFDGRETNPLIAALPAVIHIKGEDGRAVPWLETTMQYLACESASAQPGAQAVVNHLTDVLFIQAVRAYISGTAQTCKKGLIKGLTDPQIADALGLMHNDPRKSWTVESLASRVGISRAGFANRFRELVGEPPLQYLTRWRMHKAAELLRAGEHSVTEVATEIGYEADAAFSKAFKRWMGSAPGAYRRASLNA